MKKTTLSAFVIVSLFFISAGIIYVRAQTDTPSTISPTVPATSTIVSDYALDIQQGKQSVNNDVEAQNNQKEIIDNESVEAHEETEAIEPVEKVEPEEAVEPQEAIENESEGEKSGEEENSSERLKQESGSSSENDKQSDSENEQTK